jgi:hypothetical protein
MAPALPAAEEAESSLAPGRRRMLDAPSSGHLHRLQLRFLDTRRHNRALGGCGAGGGNCAAPALVWEIVRISTKRHGTVATRTLGFGTGDGGTSPPTAMGGTMYSGVDGVPETRPSPEFCRWPHRGGVDDRRRASAGKISSWLLFARKFLVAGACKKDFGLAYRWFSKHGRGIKRRLKMF